MESRTAAMSSQTADELRRSVREHYSRSAVLGTSCCGPASSCCGPAAPAQIAQKVGYTPAELVAVPDGANLGLGCGNPLALAQLEPGNVVVDLGSGAGFDCFLAAERVGPGGRVIGVDMTPEMVERALALARRHGFSNVEFRLGEIEALPVPDATADMVISNCVINLSPDKARVFAEAYRVLKPGGVLMVSDLVLRRPLPEPVRASIEAYVGCVAGASLHADYLALIAAAGFEHVEVLAENTYPLGVPGPDAAGQEVAGATGLSPEDLRATAEAVASIQVRALRPAYDHGD